MLSYYIIHDKTENKYVYECTNRDEAVSFASNMAAEHPNHDIFVLEPIVGFRATKAVEEIELTEETEKDDF